MEGGALDTRCCSSWLRSRLLTELQPRCSPVSPPLTWPAQTGARRGNRNFKAFPRLAHSGPPLPAVFPPRSTSLPHSHSLHHLYSQTPRALTRHFIVLAVLVSYVARHGGSDHSPGEDKLDGAATWAALCLIFFIIISSPSAVLRSHISPSLMCH